MAREFHGEKYILRHCTVYFPRVKLQKVKSAKIHMRVPKIL